MTIERQLLLTELNYTIWANKTLLGACWALSFEELSRPLVASHTSIIRTLSHIYDGERAWLHNLLTGAIPDIADVEAAGAADQSRPDPTLESLRQSWPDVWATARQWIAQVSDEDLTVELSSRERDGTVVAVPRWQVILHMVNHSTAAPRSNRQPISCAWQNSAPNTDLFTYYRSQTGRRPGESNRGEVAE